FEEVAVTARSGDGGIDVRGTMVVGDVIRTRMAVQVKRWKNNIQSPTIQQVRGSLGTHEQGLIITTSDFSSGARTEAERANAIPVALMNGDQLIELLIENDIYVRRTSYDLIEIDEGDQEAPQ
ncbi:MAG: restriction endonuclease, partial [Acidobacteriota bacterium]|nr:restriction endonuclease [Acidobacteriota bacterium]